MKLRYFPPKYGNGIMVFNQIRSEEFLGAAFVSDTPYMHVFQCQLIVILPFRHLKLWLAQKQIRHYLTICTLTTESGPTGVQSSVNY